MTWAMFHETLESRVSDMGSGQQNLGPMRILLRHSITCFMILLCQFPKFEMDSIKTHERMGRKQPKMEDTFWSNFFGVYLSLISGCSWQPTIISHTCVNTKALSYRLHRRMWNRPLAASWRPRSPARAAATAHARWSPSWTSLSPSLPTLAPPPAPASMSPPCLQGQPLNIP